MKKNLIGIIVLLTVTYVVLSLVFNPYFHNPNSYMVSKSGEAIKNYYNFSSQLKYGKNIKNELVNYPYGEHIQMDNSQPFHLLFFKVYNKISPVLKYGVAFINLSMIFSLLVILPFLFLILRRYKLPVWYSLIISLIIAFLSPQLGRIKGNFELSYLFFIPMWWYFIMKFRDGKTRWLWASLLAVTGIIGGLTNVWYVSFFTIFLFGIILADCWINRKNLKSFFKQEILLFILAIIPLIVVGGMIGATDWVSDRPANPYGFFVNHANLFSIFMPYDRIVQSFLGYTYTFFNIQWEGRANVGFPATIVAVILTCIILYRFYTRKKISVAFPEKEFNPYLLAAFLILLFSMCFPVNWGLGFLVNIIPFLKQFNAPGRFAWIFYYVFTVYTAIAIYRYFEKLKNEGQISKSRWLIVLVIFFWSMDALSNAQQSFKQVVNRNTHLKSKDDLFLRRFDVMGKKIDDFQAIFFMPFANTSGDKMKFETKTDGFIEGMKCSFHTRLPMIESFAPRISISQSLSSIQILADSCIRKERFDDMNDKPILLLTMNDSLTESEQWLKQNADSLWSDPWLTLSSVAPDFFEKSYQNWLDWADSIKWKLTGTDQLKADADISKVFCLNFDEKRSSIAFSGKGALYKGGKKVEVFYEDFPSKGMTGNYDLSFWLYIDTRTWGMPQATINEIDQYNTAINSIRLNTQAEHNVYKNWVRIDRKIALKPGMKYQLVIKGKFITLDDLLLKPTGCNVYIKKSNGLEMMNNFVMDRK
jgi:hypothetical protein